MKNRTHQSWINQSGALVLSMGLLSACGTEIGNGRKAPTLPDSSKAGNNAGDPNSSPDESSSGGTETDMSTGSGTIAIDQALKYLFIACGSPIPDMTAATYTNAIATGTMTVAIPAANSWNVGFSSQTYSILKDTSAGSPYAIKSASVTLGSQTCINTTAVVNGAETEKTIEYSDNYKTVWIVDGNSKVSKIEVQKPNGDVIVRWVIQ